MHPEGPIELWVGQRKFQNPLEAERERKLGLVWSNSSIFRTKRSPAEFVKFWSPFEKLSGKKE